MLSVPAQRLKDRLELSPARPRLAGTELTLTEWDELLAQAYHHGVAAQLFQTLLVEAESYPIPPSVARCALLGLTHERAGAARRQQELVAVLARLRQAGITPILLKGAHLGTSVYPEPLLRPMEDFDILVCPAELGAAEQALCEAGYTTRRTEPIAEVCARKHHVPPLVQEGKRPVELHWTLAPQGYGIRVDLDGLWSRAQAVTIADEPARVLAPEDALLHVCLHGTLLHLFEHGLRPLLDVVALINRHGATMDWSAVASRAHAWGVERAVYLLLYVARWDTDAGVPDEVLARLQPGGVPGVVVDAARARLFEPGGVFQGMVSTRSLAMARHRPGLVWGGVLHSGTVLERRFGLPEDALHLPLAYALWAKDLVQRWAGIGWQLARGDRSLRAAAGRIQADTLLQGWLGAPTLGHSPPEH
jgi:hypothetical protein